MALLVEVSDGSLSEDLGHKLKLYASAGVPEYWVADVSGRVIHQMWAPEGNDCSCSEEHTFRAVIQSATIAGLKIGTDGL